MIKRGYLATAIVSPNKANKGDTVPSSGDCRWNN
jgi:hypothetical protein